MLFWLSFSGHISLQLNTAEKNVSILWGTLWLDWAHCDNNKLICSSPFVSLITSTKPSQILRIRSKYFCKLLLFCLPHPCHIFTSFLNLTKNTPRFPWNLFLINSEALILNERLHASAKQPVQLLWRGFITALWWTSHTVFTYPSIKKCIKPRAPVSFVFSTHLCFITPQRHFRAKGHNQCYMKWLWELKTRAILANSRKSRPFQVSWVTCSPRMKSKVWLPCEMIAVIYGEFWLLCVEQIETRKKKNCGFHTLEDWI